MFADTIRRSTLLIWIAVLATVPACSDDVTGPGSGSFDAEATAAALQNALPDRQENDDLYTNLGNVSDRLADSDASAAVASGLPRVMALFRGEGATQVVSRAALAELADATKDGTGTVGVSLSLLLPETLLGSTLVWNPETEAYEVDETRTGAPDRGVRFVLYAVDSSTRKPSLPLDEIGHVDLIDESTDESNLRLRVRAVDTSEAEPVTLLDYVIGAELVLSGESRLTAEAEGFVSDGTDRLDFVLSQEIVLSSDASSAQGTTRSELSAPGSGVSLVLATEGTFDLATGQPTSFALALTVHDGTDEVVLNATVDAEQAIEGTVDFNGETVILVSGTADDPTFTRPDGSELSEEEREALRVLVGAIEAILDFVASVFGLFQAG